MSAPALFRRYPELAASIPWLLLGRFPTPLEPLPLAGLEHAWVKRDDLSGAAYGGNKVRKLEFLLADAIRAGARRLITAGAFGSHHALATALYGRQHGLAVTLVLFPQPVTAHVRDVVLAAAAAGADFRFVPRMELVPGALLAQRWASRREPGYVIPPGGSNPLGTLGYVNAGLELAEQLATETAPVPTEIHVAAGTLGTAAGLAIGLALAGLDTRLAATRITGRIVTNERALARLVRGALELLGPAAAPGPGADEILRRVVIRHDQIGGGYGRETPAGRAATALFESLGLRLDPTYTAKAAAGFLATAADTAVPLFWQTLSAAEPPAENRAELEHRLPGRMRALLAAA